MAKELKKWIEEDVNTHKKQGMRYLSEQFFHRCPSRPNYIDNRYMFSPADGTILGAFENIDANESLIQVKGVNFTLKDLMQEPELEGKFLVVSIFMSFYDVHLNNIPFAGNRTYEELPPLSTFNKPMLQIEQDLLQGIINPEFQEDYLRKNSREISTIFAPKLGQEYMLVRVGDYDVDVMVNFKQHDGTESTAYQQNEYFGKIQYGSQTILIIEQKEGEGNCKFKLRPEAKVGMHVEQKIDALVEIEYPEN